MTSSDLTRTSLRIGLLSFGGPAAQIALMHRVYVDEKQWLTEDEFLSALSFCMLLPGPEAMQLATYTGWKLHGVKGGLIAGLLFVVPGAVVVLTLSALYAIYGQIPLTQALFMGIKACVVVIVIEALLRVARRALKTTTAWIIAALSFLAIFAVGLPFPLIILAAGLYGALTASGGITPDAPAPPHNLPRTVVTWLAIWWTPVALAAASGAALLTEIGLYFSRLAVVTFGGAYSVLAYMAQSIVAEKAWLTTGALIDGLGLAETTPGPLILVTTFVGYQAGYAVSPLMAVGAAAMTLWVTFAPCFLWIFAGAPYIARLTARPRLKAALSAITAAVVGVILSLTVWFALHVFFTELAEFHVLWATIPLPDPASLNWRAVLIALAAAYALLFRHLNLIPVLIFAAVAGSLLARV